MSTETSCSTATTLAHHLQSLAAADVEAILTGYTESSVLYTQDGPVRGLRALREFFVEFLATVPGDFTDSFETLRQDVDGAVAYVVWRAGNAAPLGTDTFLIRDGKIATHTAAMYVAP